MEHVPVELLQQSRWVNHNQSKIPINPKTFAYASSTNPATWSDYNTAVGNAPLPLGFMLGNGVGCIDLDYCLGLDGELSAGAKEIIDLYPGNWIEVSPSGRGLHVWGLAGEMPGIKRVWKQQKIEFYSVGRYITITGETFQAGRLLPL